MKKWRRYVPVVMLALVMAATAVVTFQVKAQEAEDGIIPGRVYFGQISVGGMSGEEAAEAVQAYVDQLKETRVTLKAGENTLETTAGALGLSWSNPEIVEEAEGLGKSGNLIVRYKAMKDLEHEDKVYAISYTVDAMQVAALIEQNMEALDTEAVDAGLIRENGGFVIIPGSQGVTVNVEDSVKVVEEYFAADWEEQTSTIELVAEVVNPRGTEEELSKVQDVLGSFQTDYSTSGEGRSQNVANGASKINGSVIYPGEQFSVYEAVSPFDAENGYELAGSYENGTTVESYGGGICQVSTTLYNAAIRAELEIVERFAHSMIVGYVDPSADAAIAGTYKDLKFKNNTDAPIYIEGYTSGKVIYFTIYGHETRDPNRKVSFVSETTSSTDPGIQFRGIDAPIGTINRVQSSHEGKTARLWKVITVNGVEESREEFNTSTYRPSPAIYEVGTTTGNPEAAANINAALATQDEATIRAAADAWNDTAVAARQQQQLEQQQQQQLEQQQLEQQGGEGTAAPDDSDKQEAEQPENKDPENKDSENTDPENTDSEDADKEDAE